MRVLIGVVAVLLLCSSPAVAQQTNEMTLMVEAPGEVRVWINDTLPQEHWSDIRVSADQDQNGHVSDAEAGAFEHAMQEELENHPSEQTTLNGETVASVNASFFAQGLRGPVSDTDPVIGRADARMSYAIDPEPKKLEWERIPFEDEEGRAFSLTAPDGWMVASHNGLGDAKTSQSRVTGEIGDETLTVLLVPEDAYEAWSKEHGQSAAWDEDSEHPSGSDDDSRGDSSDGEGADPAVETAAPGVILIVGGLLTLFGLKRRR